MKTVKKERAEADNNARQLWEKLLSVERKFAASEKERVAAVAMVGQVAVSSQSGSEAHTPIRNEKVEDVKKIIDDLAKSVHGEMKAVRTLIDRSIVISNAKSPTPVFSAQLFIGLLAQGLLVKVQPNLNLFGVIVPAAKVPSTSVPKVPFDAAKKGKETGTSSTQKSAKQDAPQRRMSL